MTNRKSHARSARQLTRSIAMLAAAALVGSGMSLIAAPAASAEPNLVTDPLQYVNTMAGTAGSVNNFPGPAMPYGMVQFSPDTTSGNVQSTSRPSGAGYKYNQNNLLGFGMTHASQGCGMGGDFPLYPTSYDNLTATSGTLAPWAQKLAIVRNTYPEVGQPGYYKLTARDTSAMNGTTANGLWITSELSATTRAGIAKFTFPASTTRPKVFLRTNESAWSTASYNSELHIDPATGLVTARALVGNFCRKGEQHNIYYALRFDQAWSAFGTWVNGQASVASRTDVTTNSNSQTGGYFTFADNTEVITARVAISYTSIANAVLNLQTEIPQTRTFDSVRAAAELAWRNELLKVRVTEPVAGQNPAADPTRDLKTFYSALYHSNTHPATFNDVNGEYIGFETIPQVHNVSEKPGANNRVRTQYSMISDWDTYRCLTPFQAALVPDVASDQAQSLVNAAEQMGSFPNWTVANASTTQMNGDNVPPLLAFTHEFGARDWQVSRALELILENTIGDSTGKYTGGTNTGAGHGPGFMNTRWIVTERPGGDWYNRYGYAPQVRAFQTDHVVSGGSYTLEYAIDDFSIAQLAKVVGDGETAEQFYKRAQWWQNLWNPTADGVQPRDINGRYPETDPRLQYPQTFGYRGNSLDLGQQGWDEGNAEQYMWMVPHNLDALFDALGGKAAALDRLEVFMSNGYGTGANVQSLMNLDNEPNFGVPWVYDHLGRPDRATEVLDAISQSQFGYLPAGAEPGNDDLGALANWYVWTALGMYPETSGASLVDFNTPTFEKSIIQLGNGHTLTINAPEAQSDRTWQGGKYKYITGAKINGQVSNKPWFDFKTLENQDVTIDFTLDSTPGTWGTRDEDAPPSWREGDRPFSLNVNTVGSPTFGAVILRPGATGQAQVDVQRIGSTSQTYDVSVTTSDPGITAAAVPTQRVDQNGRDSVGVNFTVDPFLPSGYYSATITISADGKSSSEEAILRVVKPGSLEALRTITGTADIDGLKGSFDGNTGITWSSGVGQDQNNGIVNTFTNTYDRAKLAGVGLAPGQYKNIAPTGTPMMVQWPTSPIGYPEAWQPAAYQEIKLERPTQAVSLVGASYASAGLRFNIRVLMTNGKSFKSVVLPTNSIALSNWVLPSTNGSATDGTLAPAYDDSVIAWTDHRLAPETATDPGAYVFASKPYIADIGWKITSVVTQNINATTANHGRVFAIATDRPALEISATSAAVGSPLRVTGSGFAAGEPVTVSFGATPPGLTVITANALGEIDGNVTVPRWTQSIGNYAVTATAASLPGYVFDPISVNVTTTHTYSPSVNTVVGAVAGQPVDLSGSGFEPGESITITLGSSTVQAVADSAGDFTISVTAPDVAGNYTLTAIGEKSQVTFTGTAAVAPAPATPTPVVTVEVPGPVQTVPGPVVTAPGPAVTVPGPTVTAQSQDLTKPPAAKGIVKVKAAQKSLRLVKGKSVKIAAFGYTATGTKGALTWKSSKPKVAKVSATGKIKAKKVGKASITVKAANGRKATIKVTVVKAKSSAKVTKVKVKGVPKALKVGQVKYATVTWKSAKATAAKVKYKSSNSAVISIDKAGRVVARAAGKASLTFKVGKKTKRITVTVS